MTFVHPVSFLTRITAQALAADFNRVSGYARVLQQVRLLPITNGKAIERVGPDRLIPLMAAVAHAEALFDAAAVGLAFDAMPLAPGSEDLPLLKVFEGTTGPVTLGMLFAFFIENSHRHEIELDFIRYRAAGRNREFAACLWLNSHPIEFGAERPPYCARETTERVSRDAFKALREMFRHGEAEYARIAAEREAAQ
jgi:hypothetical protein